MMNMIKHKTTHDAVLQHEVSQEFRTAEQKLDAAVDMIQHLITALCDVAAEIRQLREELAEHRLALHHAEKLLGELI